MQVQEQEEEEERFSAVFIHPYTYRGTVSLSLPKIILTNWSGFGVAWRGGVRGILKQL
jgi:hypothetical protein